MAPNDQLRLKTVDQPSKATITDEDEKWTDLAENPEHEPTLLTVSPPTQFTGPFPPPQPFAPIVTAPQPFGQPTAPSSDKPYFHPPGIPVLDVFGRPLPSEQQVLEAQLVHLGEVILGLATAVHLLETELVPDTHPSKQRELVRPTYQFENGRVDLRSCLFSSERSSSTVYLRDLGYLIGLKRSVRILKKASKDTELENVTYKIIAPPPPPSMPPQAPMAVMQPAFQPGLMQNEFRAIARDIVKDTVKEYKEEISKPGVEEVQKEMIKLCREVITRDTHSE